MNHIEPADGGRGRDGQAVTYALLLYNQERYVCDAIKSAFQQTYSPLHILISDDASTDATFELARSLVSEYHGPHQVTLRRNESNLGVVRHVDLVVDLADTELIVAAAGDDISMACRTQEIYAAYVKHGHPVLLHSKAVVIDADGVRTGETAPIAELWQDISPERACRSASLYLGASGAWRKSLFVKYGRMENLHTFEDLVLGFRASLEGGAKFIDKELLYYRVMQGTLSYDLIDDSSKVERLMIGTLEQRRRDLLKSGYAGTRALLARIDRDLATWRIKQAVHGRSGDVLRLGLKHPALFMSFAMSSVGRRIRRALR